MTVEDLNLDNIDELIEHWRKMCDDIHPCNVDSMDLHGCPIDDGDARQAICLIPLLLIKIKEFMEENSTSR